MFKDRLMQIMSSSRPFPFFSLATPLQGLAYLHSHAVRQRRKLFERGKLRSFRLPCTVVSVGNIAVGGTGKTPMVTHLANHIHSRGYRVAIISRGYKGLSQKAGAIVSDGHGLKCTAREAGDEPYLMATLLSNIPVVVGKDRYAAGQMAISQFNPDVILLDDAFQHLRLKRDLDLLLLDAKLPLGNSFLLPRGRLREPACAISKADAVILTRCDRETPDSLPVEMDGGRPIPVFRSRHTAVIRGRVSAHGNRLPLNELSDDVSSLDGLKPFGFSGLANNQSFFDSVTDLGADLQGTFSFEDHHAYLEEDIAKITQAAVHSGADCIVTTDKDYVRFEHKAQLPLDLVVIGVDIEFMDDAAMWQQYIDGRIDEVVRQRRQR